MKRKTKLLEKVQFVSRYQCKQLMSRGVDDDIAVISISDTINECREMVKIFEQVEGITFIALYFSDVEKGEKGAMTEEHSAALVKFIDANYKRDIVCHCYAGVSRSGAIAKWINAYLDCGIMYLEDYMGYNRHVYDMMDRAIGNSMSQFYEQQEKMHNDN